MRRERLPLYVALLLACILHAAALLVLPPLSTDQPPPPPRQQHLVLALSKHTPTPPVPDAPEVPRPQPALPQNREAKRPQRVPALPSLKHAQRAPMEAPPSQPIRAPRQSVAAPLPVPLAKQPAAVSIPRPAAAAAPAQAPAPPAGVKPTPLPEVKPVPLPQMTRQSAPAAPAIVAPAPTPQTPAAAQTAAEASYKAQVQQRLAAAKRYPRQARRRGMEGAVRLSLTIDTKGHIIAAEVLDSSGHELLDRATLRLLDHVSPLPRPDSVITLDFTFDYDLHDR